MKPLSEPSQGRENAYLGWTDNQLLRRPPIPTIAGEEAKWAVGSCFFCNTTTGDDKSLVTIDVGDMVTNAPTVFNVDTGQLGAVGLSILEFGGYRIWVTVGFTTSYDSGLTGPNFSAITFFDYNYWFGSIAGIQCRGFNLSTDFNAGTFTQFTMFYDIDFIYYDGGLVVNGTPGNVIEFALQQNTLHGGCYEAGFQIYQLPVGFEDSNGDFSELVYLP